MPIQNYKSGETSAIEKMRGLGGTITINFCTDNVQKSVFRTLNQMADMGRIERTVSENHLIHTFRLLEAERV